MRTTLEIDDRVMVAVRTRAHVRGTSVGKALSELALVGIGIEATAPGSTSTGFPTLPSVTGHVITDEMVETALSGNALCGESRSA